MNCPICSEQIEISDKNYGAMFTCPHCSGVYYINLIGDFEVAQHEPMVDEFHAVGTNFSNSETSTQNQFSNPEIAPLMNSSDLIAADNVYEGTQLNQISNEPEVNNHFHSENNQWQQTTDQSEPQADYSQSEQLQSGQMNVPEEEAGMPEQNQSAQNYNFDQPLDQMLEQSQTLSDAFVASDANEESQVELSQGQFYQLEISGIDTAQIRDLVLEALNDRKLQIELQQLASEIQNGTLVIRGLNAVKCAVIVQRLIYVDVQMNWSRYDQE